MFLSPSASQVCQQTTRPLGRSKLDIKLDGAIFIIIHLVLVSRLLLILLHPDSDRSRFAVSEVIVTDQ